MQLILFSIIILQLAYIVYSDIQNRKERKFIQMNVEDFTDFEEQEEDSPKEEEDIYIPIEEAGIERVITSKEK